MRAAPPSLLLVAVLACVTTSGTAHAEEGRPRVRHGLDLAPYYGGMQIGDDAGAVAGGMLRVRTGLQLSDELAVHLESGFSIGSTVALSLGPVGAGSSRGQFFFSLVPTVELILANRFQIALGGGGWIGSDPMAPGAALILGAGGSHRIGMIFGGRGEGTRRGFSLGLQVDLYYLTVPSAEDAEGFAFAFSVHVGWDSF